MRVSATSKWFPVCAVMLGLGTCAQASIILGYDPNINDRFVGATFPNGTPPTPNPSGSFLLQSFDLSGIGWVPAPSGVGTKQVTMISDLQYIAAQHFPLGIGTTVAFRAADGSYVTRTVASETQIGGSDVMVGQLNLPVPQGVNGVASYPIVVGTRANFNNKTMFMFDQNGRVGRNLIGEFLPPNTTTTVNIGTGPTNVLTSDYDPNIDLDGLPGISSEFVVTGGDSGSPSMMTINGQLALMGDHVGQFLNAGTPLGSADSFLSDYQALIASQLALSGRTLQVIGVPEPGSLILFGSACALAVVRRRTRKVVA
jgi:hypothetical protein